MSPDTHGLDLRRCLVAPRKLTVDLDGGGAEDVWLVLEENPGTNDGYKIVYDEAARRFGLATPGFEKDQPFLIGWYGDFPTALRSM